MSSYCWLRSIVSLSARNTTLSAGIKQLEDSTRSLLKWLNFLLPILLVLIYGFLRFQYRKNQRVARMEADYS